MQRVTIHFSSVHIGLVIFMINEIPRQVCVLFSLKKLGHISIKLTIISAVYSVIFYMHLIKLFERE